MKRVLIVLMVVFVALGAYAQTTLSFSTFQTAFQGFATGVASALPLNSTVGLNWSDAYIGQLIDVPPHFGFGVTAGATTLPYKAVKDVLSALSITLPSSLSFMSTYGVPIPAYTIDVRIGGFFLPFDVGLKAGYLPPNALASLPFTAQYLLVGGDFRYGILADKGFMPGLSIGVGYTYMKGSIGVPKLLGSGITLSSFAFPDGSTHSIGFTDPSLNFNWNTNVIDLKVQLSKSLLIITPYIGAGASYGISNAGGGLASAMTLDGHPITQAEIDQINQATGQSFTLTNPGFAVSAAASGWSFRAFGGFSLNILVVKLDIGAAYELLSGALGATANLRFQL